MTNPRTWLHLLRVPQWTKNAVVFAALVFGDPDIEHALWRTIAAFIAFCTVSSAGYIVNDWVDLQVDLLHPAKRFRPMAAGLVGPRSALGIAGGLSAIGLTISAIVNPVLLVVMVAYLALTLAYSVRLKNIVLVDAFVIATGFLLRAVAGAAAVQVPVSPWLMLCTLLLSLFLAFGKRRSELARLQGDAANHRSALASYSVTLLDHLLVITAGCTIMAYSFYSFSSESVPQNGVMMITVPFVMFAVFRYLLLVMRRGEGGTPEILLWRDRPLLASVVAWATVVIAIMVVVE
jgi:4-hydroxybenzoate polyprenyltransferase